MLRALIFIVALLSGGLAAWLALALQPTSGPTVTVEKVSEAPAVEILVAATPLAQGQVLEPASMHWQPWAEAMAVEGMITRRARPDAPDTLSGSFVRSGFVAGEPIREDKLVAADSGFMSAILPSGKRAVAVRISAENTAGGFILPEDRVDVVHTVSRPDADGGPSQGISQTILRNIRVLAIDQIIDESSATTTVIGKTATLEVDPEQVETASAAEASGSLSLALRSRQDNEEATPEIEPVAQAAPSQRVVQIIRSGSAEMVSTKASTRD